MLRHMTIAVAALALSASAAFAGGECGKGMTMGADHECHAKGDSGGGSECGKGMTMGADHECHAKDNGGGKDKECGKGMVMGNDHECHPKP